MTGLDLSVAEELSRSFEPCLKSIMWLYPTRRNIMNKSTINPNVTNKESKGSYAPVSGLNMYYETHGTGKPLVLLHGGVGAIQMFGEVLPSLAQNRQVVAVDLQAHGRTADIDRPLSFELMAGDIAALINRDSR